MNDQTSPLVVDDVEIDLGLSPDDVAKRLGISADTVKRAIRYEVEHHVEDRLRYIPGGRHFNTNYRVERDIFEKGRRGELPVPAIAVEEPAEPQSITIQIAAEPIVIAAPPRRRQSRPGAHAINGGREKWA